MPNGTVDHFRLKGSEIVEMLREFDADTVIGHVRGLGDSINEPRPLTGASLKQIAQEAVEEQVGVFEQDYGDYILPFSGGAFVCIDEKSALHEKLAQYNHEFKMKLLAEHRRQSRGDEPKDDSNS